MRSSFKGGLELRRRWMTALMCEVFMQLCRDETVHHTLPASLNNESNDCNKCQRSQQLPAYV